MFALPIIYQADNEMMKDFIDKNGTIQTKAEVDKMIKSLGELIWKYRDMCVVSQYPVKICGKRTNCCG